MKLMFDDEEGAFRFGARAMARGDVEKKILEYCKKNQIPFDVAYAKMWKEKKFTTALGTPYDLSIEENKELQLKRSYLDSIRLDSQYSDIKQKFSTVLEVETGKELDSKRKDVEFSSSLQLIIATQSALRTAYNYFRYDMSMEEREKYLREAGTVMMMLELDLQRYPTQLRFIESRVQAFVAWIFTPKNGRTKITNINGKVTISCDKKLIIKYNELVRGYLNHNVYAAGEAESPFVVPDLCIAYNLGVNCTFGENCKNLKKWHEFFTHWCVRHGRPALHKPLNTPRHPLVTCKHFRATWKPVPPPPNAIDNNTYERPDIRKFVANRATRPGFDSSRGRGGFRGRGGRGGRGRGRGRGRRFWNDGYSYGGRTPTAPKPTTVKEEEKEEKTA